MTRRDLTTFYIDDKISELSKEFECCASRFYEWASLAIQSPEDFMLHSPQDVRRDFEEMMTACGKIQNLRMLKADMIQLGLIEE